MKQFLLYVKKLDEMIRVKKSMLENEIKILKIVATETMNLFKHLNDMERNDPECYEILDALYRVETYNCDNIELLKLKSKEASLILKKEMRKKMNEFKSG